ncbi:hypothetical protein EDC01DRAFT_634147 [Geopyxis carbonaria]|nr:hypothetical protein EDC01DRAFT_634147 [Geopyxis carbonaria]
MPSQDNRGLVELDYNCQQSTADVLNDKNIHDSGFAQHTSYAHRNARFPYVVEDPLDFMIGPVPSRKLTTRISVNPREAVIESHNALLLSGQLNVGHKNLISTSEFADNSVLATLPELHSSEPKINGAPSIMRHNEPSSLSYHDGSSEISLDDLLAGRYWFGEFSETWHLPTYMTPSTSFGETFFESSQQISLYEPRNIPIKKTSTIMRFLKKHARSLRDRVLRRNTN